MFYGYWQVILIILPYYLTVTLTGAATVSGNTPTPKLEIIQKGKLLHFQASAPSVNPARCWTYHFHYRKCNENETVIEVHEQDKWTATVEYDAACKYTVRVQASYSEYCEGKMESNMSEPVNYGEDHDPTLAFKVAMIITPVIVSSCVVVALVLFTRHKDKFLPKVPDPSQLFGDMLNNNKNGELFKGPGVGELYVACEGDIETIVVGPQATLI